MQHLLLALELQQGNFPSSDGWIEDLSDTQGVGITQELVIE